MIEGSLARILRMPNSVSRTDIPSDANRLHESCLFSYARLEYLMELAEAGVPSEVLVDLNNQIINAWIGPDEPTN